MTVQQLRGARDTKPFRPFTVHMADGRSFHVPHPEFLVMSPTGRTVIIFKDDDEMSILDLLLMTEIQQTPSGSKGKKKS